MRISKAVWRTLPKHCGVCAVSGKLTGLPRKKMSHAQSAERQSGAAAQQIQIAADSFMANTAENYAEFTGNVQAVQGAFEILSDSLRVYYKPTIQETGILWPSGTPR